MIRTLTLAAAAALTAGIAFADDPIDTFENEATVGMSSAAQVILANEALQNDDFIGNRLNGASEGVAVSTKGVSTAGLEIAYKNAVENNDRAQAAYLADKLGL